jgi:hypothetical protein
VPALVGLVVLPLLLSACAAGPVVLSNADVDGWPDHSFRDILRHLPSAPSDLDELAAVAEVSVASPDESGRFSARIAYRKNDSMLVRVRFPLGIEGARVLVTPDSAFVYDRTEGTLVMGTPDNISAVLPVAVAGTDLVALATGFIQPDPRRDWQVRTDSLLYELRDAGTGERWLIDPVEWRVVYAEFRNPDGGIREQRWYASFEDMDGVRVPRRVSVSHPTRNTRLVMALSRLDTSPDELSFDLGLAPDIRRYMLR